MNSAWYVVAFAAGAALGTFYFGGLWITVRRLSHSPQPAFLMFVSYLLRVAVALTGFYLIMDGRWERLAASMVGFLLARGLVVRWMHGAEDASLPQSPVSARRTAQ